MALATSLYPSVWQSVTACTSRGPCLAKQCCRRRDCRARSDDIINQEYASILHERDVAPLPWIDQRPVVALATTAREARPISS